MAGERRRLDVWRAAVVWVAAFAGLLFAASANTARGTELRSSGRSRLTELIAAQQRQVESLDATAARLRAEVGRSTADAARGNTQVAALERINASLAVPVGLSALRGPGLTVTLDDAPRLGPGEMRPGNPTPDDLVVHEQDVLGVINAFWAGGADAIAVMGERIVATSAVRCVGNTLLLHGAVYSPPFTVAAIGDPERLGRALDESRGVQLFRSYVAAYGLGYRADRATDLPVPAYDGVLSVTHGRVVE
ncbi:MAG: hypothetical protein QOE45_1116 [Frankiaceae bacterium]|nr:hypothetical protein [Frankiaceae bacterium]